MMGIIAVQLPKRGGNPELVDGARRGLTFKKLSGEGPLLLTARGGHGDIFGCFNDPYSS